MDYALLLIALLASVALAIGIGRLALAVSFHLMHEGFPCTFHWRPVVFAAALFWFWYLAPVMAESRAATAVIRFVSIQTAPDQTREPVRSH